MAISPEDIRENERYIKGKIESIERYIDSELPYEFSRNSSKVTLYIKDDAIHDDRVAQELLKKYSDAGWLVELEPPLKMGGFRMHFRAKDSRV
jgi:hypothetical protein